MKRPATKGRGTNTLPGNRFSDYHTEEVDDGWFSTTPNKVVTQVRSETVKTIISHNRSPDVPFEQSINPYRGCEHGCIYCFARPSHAYLDLSPGLDFESKLTAKINAVERLHEALSAKNYQCKPINLGANTDPYQPIERKYQLTRGLLGVLNDFNHPCSIITKSSLIERDIDLITSLAKKNLVHVTLSVTTLNHDLSRKLEPRAGSPQRRLQTIRTLRQAAIPVSVLIAPVIPVLTDPEMETILKAVQHAGAQHADYILLRLPYEVAPLFKQWLNDHYPDMSQHVQNRIHDLREGKDNDPRFGHRLKGQGIYAQLFKKRFQLAAKRYQLTTPLPPLSLDQFNSNPTQLSLW